MAIMHSGATLPPHFREFLPGWLANQSWYQGASIQLSLTPVGYFRFEDPAGAAGVETHLVEAGSMIYQIPMTYRDAPLLGCTAADRLITTAEHSVLGTRWIYDAENDPVWQAAVLDLVRTEGVSELSGRSGVAPTVARGRRRTTSSVCEKAVIELNRVLTPGPEPEDPGALGFVLGSWHPEGADWPAVGGCLATVR